MTHKLKALGLAVVAVLSMSAVVVSAAQAAPAEFTAESYPVIGTANQVGTNTLTIGNGARVVSCMTAKYDLTTLSAATTEIQVLPTYTGCTSTAGLPVTVTTKSCEIDLTGTTSSATTGTLGGRLTCISAPLIIDVYANATKHAENIRACEYEIKEQTIVSVGGYRNIGAGSTREIELNLNATMFTKNLVGSKLLCGLAAGETGFSTLAGTQILEGRRDGSGAHDGLFVS